MGNNLSIFSTKTVENSTNSWTELLQQPCAAYVFSSSTFQLLKQCNNNLLLHDSITPSLVYTSHVTTEQYTNNIQLVQLNNETTLQSETILQLQDIPQLINDIQYVDLHKNNVSYRELLDLIKIHSNSGFNNIKTLLTVLIQFAEQCVYDKDTVLICNIIDSFLYQLKNVINAYALLLLINNQIIPYTDGTESTELILLASRSFTFKNLCKTVTNYPYDIMQCYKDKNYKVAHNLINELYYHTDINFQCADAYYSDFSLQLETMQELQDVSNLPRLLVHYVEHSLSKDNWHSLHDNWSTQINILQNVRLFLQSFKLSDIYPINRNQSFPVIAFFDPQLTACHSNLLQVNKTVTHFAIPYNINKEEWQKCLTELDNAELIKIIYYCY